MATKQHRKAQDGLRTYIPGLGHRSIEALHRIRGARAGKAATAEVKRMSPYIQKKLHDMGLIHIYPWKIGAGLNWAVTELGNSILIKK